MKPGEGTTMIGKSVVIRGDLSGSEDLFLDGQLTGSVTMPDSRLTVGPNARLNADVTVQELVVLGQITGNISASGRVELRNTATVGGDILAGRLSVEEGAAIKGKVELRTQAGKAEAAAPVRTVVPVAPAAVAAAPAGATGGEFNLQSPAVAPKTEPLFKA